MLPKCSVLRPFGSVLFSALFCYGLAQAMFTRRTLRWLYKILGIWPVQSVLLLLGDTEQKLQKMHSLWNPPEHPFPYLAYALFVHWTIQMLLNAKEKGSDGTNAIPRGQKPSFFQMFVADALPVGLCVALFTTILSLCAQRVGEMHSLVIALQFVHSSVTCVMTAFISMVGREWKTDGEKEKSN
ncbi:hypothetical protein niasHT_015432 [Heterodera trifolii]|uniref:Transmembrane protein n=1 Tax=Heterodera trifolii TaxID=157864 RepID=A0ABD2KZW0_9BILA